MITRLDTDLSFISKLDDEPNDVGGMSAAELKAEFDRAANEIKAYINNVLLPFLESASGGANIGLEHVPGLTGVTEVQSAFEKVEEQMQNISQGAVADNSIDTEKIVDGAVTEGKLGAMSVSSGKLADSAVTGDKIDALAVTAEKLGALAIITEKLSDLCVTTAKLADKAVTTAKIGDYAVGQNQIDSYAVTEEKLSVGAVSSRTIAGSAVTAEKIAANAVSRAKLAQDALYSPIENVTAGRAITVADLGRTITAYGNSESNFVFILAKGDLDNCPTGYEVAIYWRRGASVRIDTSGGIYLGIEGNSSSILNGKINLNNRFAMVALKKIASNEVLVTGSAEVSA